MRRLLSCASAAVRCAALAVGILGITSHVQAAPQDQGYRYQPNMSGQAAPQSQGERFFLVIPEGWQEVIRANQNGTQTLAYVPPGQNGNQWTDMLMVQVMHNMTALPAQSFYERTRSSYQKSCAASNAGQMQTGLSNGYPSAFWVLSCGQNQQFGFGETAFFRLVQGQTALYIVQRTWRTAAYEGQPPVSPDSSQAAVETLKSFGVCDPGFADHPCPQN